MKKETVHIISHSHWDREWYLPFEQHRMRLVELFDTLFDLFDTGDDYKCFFLDGQTIVIDDYLAIKPENRDKLIKYVKEGRLLVGPWYVLQDEFLTSSESNVRNLLTGLREAKKYGEPTMVGYFPDAFGNAGQMPQLLKQAGMDAVIFGRGVKPIGPDNEVTETGDFESVYSEMNWASPDGSELFGILFANWYSNGNEIPVDEEEAKRYWEARLNGVRRFASTGEYLLMNGCDHQPVQANLAKAIETARKLYPDIEFKHSDFPTYIKAVKENSKNKLSTVTGELTSQQTDGWYTLVNTSSSRIYLKQMNRKNEVMLSSIAEPLASAASFFGAKVPAHWFDYAWKKLMQHHPHASLCGCSGDEVNREMTTRSEKSMQVTDELIKNSLKTLANAQDTSMFGENEIPFAAFNTSGWDKSGIVDAEIYLSPDYSCRWGQIFEEQEKLNVSDWCVKDTAGNLYACAIEDLGVVFDYDLPKDAFRRPYLSRKLRVTFDAPSIPAMGVCKFALCPVAKVQSGSLITGENVMENDLVKVEIAADGTFTLTDKKSGASRSGLGYYEDTGDIGNEYIYAMPKNTTPILSRGMKADIRIAEDSEFRAVYEIKHKMMIPKSADDTLEKERRHLVEFRSRKAGRSAELVETEITTTLTLERQNPMLKIKSSLDNQSSDHRLRMMFPSCMDTDTHIADSIFEAAERSNRVSKEWQNPSNCQHQQYFAGISDGKIGMTVANIGLNEYEVLPDDNNTIAVTLLRCTGEIGDWGVFPTPEAQCIGKTEVELAVMLHAGNSIESGAFAEAYKYQQPILTMQTKVHSGSNDSALIDWSGDSLALTSLKPADNGNGNIIRFVNYSGKPTTLKLKVNFPHSEIAHASVTEIADKVLGKDNITAEINPHEIYTLLIK